MIKAFSTWKDHPDIPVEECEKHYLEKHTQLAFACFRKAPGFRAYVINRVLSQAVHDYNSREARPVSRPDMDRIVELHFDDRESLEAAFEQPEMQAAFDDHHHFMDIDRPVSLRVYEVEEVIALERDFVRQPSDKEHPH